jgi:hypothetical protein
MKLEVMYGLSDPGFALGKGHDAKFLALRERPSIEMCHDIENDILHFAFRRTDPILVKEPDPNR